MSTKYKDPYLEMIEGTTDPELLKNISLNDLRAQEYGCKQWTQQLNRTLVLIEFATCAPPATIASEHHWARASVTSSEQFRMLFYFTADGQRVTLDHVEDINERRMLLLFVAYACAPKGFIIP
jgi:hypothetical protein